MAMEDYEGPATLIFENDIQAEAQSVRVTVSSGANPVKTMRKGLAGKSDGAGQCDIAVTSAVPKAKLEGDFIRVCVRKAFVRVVFVLAGIRYQVEGWVQDVTVNQQQDTQATVDVNIMGGLPQETGTA